MDEWSRLMAAQEREPARGLCGCLPTPAPQPAGCAVPVYAGPGERQAPHVRGLPRSLQRRACTSRVLQQRSPQPRRWGRLAGSCHRQGRPGSPPRETPCLLQAPPPQTPAPYRARAYPGVTQAPPLPCSHERANGDRWGGPLQPNPVHGGPPLALPALGLAAPTLRARAASRPQQPRQISGRGGELCPLAMGRGSGTEDREGSCEYRRTLCLL